MTSTILQGDCLQILPTLPPATCLWADPPDNLGLRYADQIKDKRPADEYVAWLKDVVRAALLHGPKVFWLSHYYKYLPAMLAFAAEWQLAWECRLFLWRFQFGQHRDTDFGNGFRPILRFSRPGTCWYTQGVRVPSARTLKYHDKRANAAGRVPDDVWDFPRVCGTFHERRPWHPNQHPIALMKRIVAVSCLPGDTVIDLFGGTGSCLRACRELGVACTSIELSHTYCENLQKDLDTARQER